MNIYTSIVESVETYTAKFDIKVLVLMPNNTLNANMLVR
jgi:hypothetical protein